MKEGGKMKIDVIKLIISVSVCLLVGVMGSFFTMPSIQTWYATLNKPFFSPPDWLFGPVWTILYFLMGLSLYIVWDKGLESKQSQKAVFMFGVQLFLNLLWSIIFFGLKSPLFAFIEIVFLWMAILLTINYFYKISKVSSYLLIPYVLWVSFAAILNFSVFYLN